MVSRPHSGTNRSVLAGTARVELCVQGSADLVHLDDGPYEAGGEKEQDPRLIPVPANSYLGREPSPARSRSNPLLLSLSPRAHPSVSVSALCGLCSGCPRPRVSPPAPAGLLFVTNIDSSDPDQLVYKTLDPADRLPGLAGDLALNSYLGL